MRRCLTLGLMTVAMSAPSAALAQSSSNCPPGAWFCEDAELAPPPGTAEAPPPNPAAATPPAPSALPAPRAPRPPEARPATRAQPARPAPPPVVVYQPVPYSRPAYTVGPPVLVRQVPPPPPKRILPPTRWGLNLRVEGVAMARRRGSSGDVGIGGIGLSFRFRPIPALAIDAGFDVLGGRDYNGFMRTELPLSLNGILYVNPKSRVQFYVIGGVDWSFAEVRSNRPSPLLSRDFMGTDYGAEYTYFGGHGGLGLEFRLSRHVALDLDGMAFVRSRTDGGLAPEFYDPRTGRTTNTSGGGILRFGVTFWW